MKLSLTHKWLRHIIIIIMLICNCKLFSHKTAVFILGAPRSGTSATTGVLKIMGLNLGNNLSKPRSWNPKGDFEDQDTIDLNRIILNNLHISPYNFSIDRALDLYDDKAWLARCLVMEHLSVHFSRYEFFGIKHPKMCLILPLYIEAAQNLGYLVKLIVVKRDPVDIIASLNKTEKQQNNILNYENGLAYINSFMFCIEMYSWGFPKLELNFMDLIMNTKYTLTRLNEYLPELHKFQDVQCEIEQFLDKKLVHNCEKRIKYQLGS